MVAGCGLRRGIRLRPLGFGATRFARLDRGRGNADNRWNHVRRAVLLLALLGLCGLTATRPRASAAPVPAAFESSIQPCFAEHCYDCHDTRHHKGSLDLSKFQTAADVTAAPDTWDLVVQKLRSGEMPPDDEIRPEPEDVARVTKWSSDEVTAADATATPKPGHLVVRRLNRAEYNNTVRDLVGLDLRPAADFPQADTGYGFDTIGAV